MLLIFINNMSNKENFNAEYVKKIMNSVDPDLALLIVFSGVSLDPNFLLKTIITCVDISYYRNMVRDMNKTAGAHELSADEIAHLLEGDGWII